MDPIASPDTDLALVPFLQASDAVVAEQLLADLLGNRVDRTIRDVVRRVLHTHVAGGARPGADLEDVRSEAVARVLRRLRELKAHHPQEPIQNLDAYTARIAERACYEYLRRRHPERARLRNQVWYVLTHDPALTLERGTNGNWICGLASLRAHGSAGRKSVPVQHRRSLPSVIRSALLRLDRPIDLNELVDLVAQALGIHDSGPATPSGPEAIASGVESIADPAALPPLAALENEQFVKWLWAEVQQLPLRQRTALLLNLRDAAGCDALDLLPLTGTASIREIAGALSIEAEAFARLWPELPLEDRRIAERLGVSRQQVINLRKAARARLSRRMAAFATTGGRRRW